MLNVGVFNRQYDWKAQFLHTKLQRQKATSIVSSAVQSQQLAAIHVRSKIRVVSNRHRRN